MTSFIMNGDISLKSFSVVLDTDKEVTLPLGACSR